MNEGCGRDHSAIGDGGEVMTEKINMLSSHSPDNPHIGTTFLNLDNVTFQIERNHVTVFFPQHQGSVTFAKHPDSTKKSSTIWRRVIGVTAAIGTMTLVGAAGWMTWKLLGPTKVSFIEGASIN